MLKQSCKVLLLAVSALGFTFAHAADESAASKGQKVYELRCLHCHGENADGKGHLISFLKITPANLTMLRKDGSGKCVTERVLKAVLGRHAAGKGEHKMPLLKDYLSVEEIYNVSEYIKTKQK